MHFSACALRYVECLDQVYNIYEIFLKFGLALGANLAISEKHNFSLFVGPNGLNSNFSPDSENSHQVESCYV